MSGRNRFDARGSDSPNVDSSSRSSLGSEWSCGPRLRLSERGNRSPFAHPSWLTRTGAPVKPTIRPTRSRRSRLSRTSTTIRSRRSMNLRPLIGTSSSCGCDPIRSTPSRPTSRRQSLQPSAAPRGVASRLRSASFSSSPFWPVLHGREIGFTGTRAQRALPHPRTMRRVRRRARHVLSRSRSLCRRSPQQLLVRSQRSRCPPPRPGRREHGSPRPRGRGLLPLCRREAGVGRACKARAATAFGSSGTAARYSTPGRRSRGSCCRRTSPSGQGVTGGRSCRSQRRERRFGRSSIPRSWSRSGSDDGDG